MRIKGREIKGANVETLVIPRGDGEEDIVFKAKAILDMEPFFKMCKEPSPPTIRTKTGVQSDFKSEVYLKAVEEHNERRSAWMIITSLTATDGLVWSTVDLQDPNTWLNYRQEFKDSGFSQVEVNRIIGLTFIANCLDESKLEAARNRFLASQLKLAVESSSPLDGLVITPSGELANASE